MYYCYLHRVTNPFIHSFQKYLLSIYYEPIRMLSTRFPVLKKISTALLIWRHLKKMNKEQGPCPRDRPNLDTLRAQESKCYEPGRQRKL